MNDAHTDSIAATETIIGSIELTKQVAIATPDVFLHRDSPNMHSDIRLSMQIVGGLLLSLTPQIVTLKFILCIVVRCL